MANSNQEQNSAQTDLTSESKHNHSSASSTDQSQIVVGILSFIAIGILGGIANNWDTLGPLFGGLILAVLAFVIITASTEGKPSIQNATQGAYILGSLFSGVTSFLSVGWSKWITIHVALSWLYFVVRN